MKDGLSQRIKIDKIDALLPQTQCRECGFAGCRPYAEALVKGEAPIDRCPPGGISVLENLGDLLGRDPTPFMESMKAKTREPALAFIHEEECIGCTKCIEACPVDAIIGSGKKMHTILADECTGCGLCVEPCPVDCIELLPLEVPSYQKDLARQRHYARKTRKIEAQAPTEMKAESPNKQPLAVEFLTQNLDAKQAYFKELLAKKAGKQT